MHRCSATQSCLSFDNFFTSSPPQIFASFTSTSTIILQPKAFCLSTNVSSLWRLKIAKKRQMCYSAMTYFPFCLILYLDLFFQLRTRVRAYRQLPPCRCFSFNISETRVLLRVFPIEVHVFYSNYSLNKTRGPNVNEELILRESKYSLFTAAPPQAK